MPGHFFHIAYDPIYAHPLPAGHRFPMLKYELIPGQLLHEGTIAPHNLVSPAPCPDHIVLLTHEEEYIDRLKNQTLSAREQREIGFPQNPELSRREFIIAQGTIDCCEAAEKNGIAFNVAGGTHHAFAGKGEGFCMINDFAVAANFLLSEKQINKILIVDLDVHQGNGTASIFKNDNRVFTFSMHGEHNYPFRKEKSDLDIGLPDGIGDAEYLSVLERNLENILEQEQPEIIFYLSGVDVLATDQFGKLKLSIEGCKRRDEIVLNLAHEKEIPCVVAMGGGYSKDVRIITEAHCNTFRLAKKIFELH